MKKCEQCGTEFEPKRARAKYCSTRCRVTASRFSVTNDQVSVTEPVVSVTFEFSVTYKPLNEFDPAIAKDRAKIRTAKYWYDVPLAAIPVYQEGWPKMPDYMNGRQYFLWWKNDFKTKEDGTPIIFNPYPVNDKIKYHIAGQGSRIWGA